MIEYIMESILESLSEADDVFLFPQGDNEIIVMHPESTNQYLIKITPAQTFRTDKVYNDE